MRQFLSRRLRLETRALHVQAEKTGIMRELLRGTASLASYCGLLRNLHDIYAALEEALDRHARHPLIAPIRSLRLQRRRALAHDLDVLSGPGWSQRLPVQPACRRYVQRLRLIGKTQPELLTAHAYVRYLGDLSGGRILYGTVGAAFGAAGTAFYDFGEEAACAKLAAALRSALDGAAATGELADAIVHEAKRSFQLHIALFDELSPQRSERPQSPRA
jgi:heme oxygenase